MGAAASADEAIPQDIAAALVDPACYADHRIHDAYRWQIGRAHV